ncbi:MAG: ABC transporter ATP-binding protein [Thermoanaerobaculia bacterium]
MTTLPESSPTTAAPREPGAAPAILLEDVSLYYRLARQRAPSFKEYAIHWIRGALVHENFWALRDVSVSIGRGEAVGVIGLNGAGKSSLLKVLAGVLTATSGTVRIDGHVTPILELGTGFDYELTGRENIYLNGLLLGHSRAEIRARERSIIDFTDLGEFIDSPIRTYSTGMVGRLGFSIATAWTPEILLLDEVFAAGDAAFMAKCVQRMREFRDAGVTQILVSHSPETILTNCERCLWIDHGRLMGDGEPLKVIQDFAVHIMPKTPAQAAEAETGASPGTGTAASD